MTHLLTFERRGEPPLVPGTVECRRCGRSLTVYQWASDDDCRPPWQLYFMVAADPPFLIKVRRLPDGSLLPDPPITATVQTISSVRPAAVVLDGWLIEPVP